MAGHRAHDRFGKSVGLPGSADQHSGMRVRYHVNQADPVWRVERPPRNAIGLLGERRLERLQAGHALQQETGAIDQIKILQRAFFAQTGFDHRAQ